MDSNYLECSSHQPAPGLRCSSPAKEQAGLLKFVTLRAPRMVTTAVRAPDFEKAASWLLNDRFLYP
jgi:hypothetical protein